MEKRKIRKGTGERKRMSENHNRNSTVVLGRWLKKSVRRYKYLLVGHTDRTLTRWYWWLLTAAYQTFFFVGQIQLQMALEVRGQTWFFFLLRLAYLTCAGQTQTCCFMVFIEQTPTDWVDSGVRTDSESLSQPACHLRSVQSSAFLKKRWESPRFSPFNSFDPVLYILWSALGEFSTLFLWIPVSTLVDSLHALTSCLNK